jgi:hypothetical protein
MTSPPLGGVFPLLSAERPHATAPSGIIAMVATTMTRLRFQAIIPRDQQCPRSALAERSRMPRTWAIEVIEILT